MNKNFIRPLRIKNGFTLVETMVVLIIMAVLIAVGIRIYMGYIGNSKLIKANDDIATIQAALDSYYQTNQFYPSSQDYLTSAGLSSLLVYYQGQANINNALYAYSQGTVANKYYVYLNMSVNGMYAEGTGTSGISSPATLTANYYTN
jgi:prepilin-type N-terminal cleavage/methylation domain-containing protein